MPTAEAELRARVSISIPTSRDQHNTILKKMAASLRYLSRSFSLVSRSFVKPIRGEVENVPGSVSFSSHLVYLFIYSLFLSLEHAISNEKQTSIICDSRWLCSLWVLLAVHHG